MNTRFLNLLLVTLAAWHCGSNPALAAPGTKCQVTIDCTKSVVMAKASPRVAVYPQFQGLPFELFVICGSKCGGTCTNPAVVVAATTTMTLTRVVPPDNLTVTVVTNLNPVPASSSNGTFNSYVVAFPASPPVGIYEVVGSTAVTFSDGITLTARGDAKLTIAEPASNDPAKPKLDLIILSDPLAQRYPGDQENVLLRISNNDAQSLEVKLSADSSQIAVRPEGGDEGQGVYWISSPFGDDFPVAWNPPGCVPLPLPPHSQDVLSAPTTFTLAPGAFTDKVLGIRSWGQCADGSCSEYWIRAEAARPNGEKLVGCASGALWVDSTIARGSCANAPNGLLWLRSPFGTNPHWDINGNGVPDLIEIESEAVPDRNRNGIPDAAEYSTILQVLFPAVGNGVNKLTGDPRFPLGLDFFQAQDGLDLNTAFFDSGSRAEGVIVPTKTGNHRFYIASDDQSEFWLSTDENPANLVMLAGEPQWAPYREFTGNAGGRRPPLVNLTLPNVSDWVYLIKDQVYPIDVLQKQGSGGNNLSVAVQEPGGPPVVNGQSPIGVGLTFPRNTPPGLSGVEVRSEPNSAELVDSILWDGASHPVIHLPEHHAFTFTPLVTGSAPMEWKFTVNGVTHGSGYYPFTSTILLDEAPANLDVIIQVSNPFGLLTRTLTIEVEEDVQPPQVGHAYWASYSDGSTAIYLGFSEGIQSIGTINFEVQSANGQAVEVLAAGYIGTRNSVKVLVPHPTDLTGSTIVLRGIKDLAGNELPPTQLTLGSLKDVQIWPIGLPLPTNPPVFDAGDTFEITARGADVWGTSDQCIFYSTPTTGDFDVRVQIDDMTASNQDAKAGLMFRVSTDPNSASIFNCLKPWGPTLDGLFSGHGNNEVEAGVRRTTGGQTTSWGTLFPPPASFPNRWLRLQRAGNEFRAYHSPNGMDWTQHGETTLIIPPNGWLGLFAVSHNVNYVTTARFSNFGPAQSTPVTIDTRRLRDEGIIAWNPLGGQVYASDFVSGPFRPLAGAVAPFAPDTTGSQQFFKIGPRKTGTGAISGDERMTKGISFRIC